MENRKTVWFRPILERVGPYVEGFTVLLSVFAVVLILLAQFPPGGPVPLQVAGVSSELAVQGSIWTVFVVIFALYGLTHRRLLTYVRKFWLELVVCITWIPFMDLPFVQQMHAAVPLILIGTMAHFLRAARWVMKRFERHPFVMLGTATVVLVVVASTILMKVEPETFTSFQETVFFVYMTALTLGAKSQASTLAGEIVVMVVATAGVGVVAVVIGTVREFMQRRIFGDTDMQVRTIKQLEAHNTLLQQLLAEQQRLGQQVSELRDRRLPRRSEN
jgi:hypothetical protein